jgi:hypothetical protein
MGNITWRTLRSFALLDHKYAIFSMFELFFNYLKNKKKKVIGDRKSWRIRYAKNSRFSFSLFQPQMSFQLYNQLLSKPLEISKLWSPKRIRNWIAKLFTIRKVTVVFVDMYPWRTLRDVRYAENGKFLKSFGTESKEFWQKSSSIYFSLDIIDLKQNENGKVFDIFLLVWLKVSWYVWKRKNQFKNPILTIFQFVSSQCVSLLFLIENMKLFKFFWSRGSYFCQRHQWWCVTDVNKVFASNLFFRNKISKTWNSTKKFFSRHETNTWI